METQTLTTAGRGIVSGFVESQFRLQRLGWPTPYDADSLDLTDARLADEGWCACCPAGGIYRTCSGRSCPALCWCRCNHKRPAPFQPRSRDVAKKAM